MSTEAKDLRELVAQLLEDRAGATFAPTYTSSDPWPIHFRKTPDGSGVPDKVLVVSLYSVGAPYRQGVQVKVRGSRSSRTDAEDQAKAAERALHGLTGQSRGTIAVELFTYLSTLPLGIDANGREELAVNFHAVTSDPGTALDHD